MLAKAKWRTISWRAGTKGKLKARFAAVRVRVADHGVGEQSSAVGEDGIAQAVECAPRDWPRGRDCLISQLEISDDHDDIPNDASAFEYVGAARWTDPAEDESRISTARASAAVRTRW